jgi:formylglycine-generating enzyme required for sulfatase activity
MRFVPVGDLQFSVWPTRVSDFETFASATALKSTVWREPGFPQNPDHPVVNVTWTEAELFCKWLTFKEQRDGSLPRNKIYRLPTDLEWSKAVGLPEETGRTPKARDMGVLDVYPWGTQWPPPPGVGNYTGEETGSEVAIRGYNDGFPWTAPVGSFQPNNYGLYDMGGNVWQWVNDVWSPDSKAKVLRGASWYNGAIKLSLLSSCRVAAAQDSSKENYGFRCVVATESSNAPKR